MLTPLLDEPTRAVAWQELAARLELLEAEDRERFLRELLGLGAAKLGPIYQRALGEDTLFLLDYLEPRGGGVAVQLVSVCLLRLRRARFAVSLRASPRLHPVLESLNASATGSERLRLPDAAFNQQITVYARDSQAALELLGPAVRRVMLRALRERDATPSLLLGERYLLFLNRGREQAPTKLPVLEALTSDMLSLYAALLATLRAEEGKRDST